MYICITFCNKVYFGDGSCQFRMVARRLTAHRTLTSTCMFGKPYSGHSSLPDQVLSHGMVWEGSPIKENLESISISSNSLRMGRLKSSKKTYPELLWIKEWDHPKSRLKWVTIHACIDHDFDKEVNPLLGK